MAATHTTPTDPSNEASPSTPKTEHTFERFVKGEGNTLACSACQAVADEPGGVYNPLFIHGPVGLGKTHLLHAIGNHILANHPWQRVVSITSERFAIELVHSIRNKRTDQFRKRFRHAHALLIDDVHFLTDKPSTQEELFHTFDELYENGRQVVLTSDRPPSELSQLQERLVSRFRWGLVADLQPPSWETRMAILRLKAAENGLPVDEEVLSLLAQRVATSVRALEGALVRLIAYAELQGEPLSAALVDDLVPPSGGSSERAIDIETIKAEVARRYNVTVEALESSQRSKPVAQARHIAIYLARELTDSSFPAIGRAFGRRDHTTAMHACQKVRAMCQTPLFASEIKTLKRTLLEGPAAGPRTRD